MDRGGSSSDSTGRKQRQEKIKDGQTREEDVATVDLFSFKTPPVDRPPVLVSGCRLGCSCASYGTHKVGDFFSLSLSLSTRT